MSTLTIAQLWRQHHADPSNAAIRQEIAVRDPAGARQLQPTMDPEPLREMSITFDRHRDDLNRQLRQAKAEIARLKAELAGAELPPPASEGKDRNFKQD